MRQYQTQPINWRLINLFIYLFWDIDTACSAKWHVANLALPVPQPKLMFN
jgi:hypothetical protein